MEQPPTSPEGPPPLQNHPQPPPGLPLAHYAGPQPPTADERTMGMLIHLLSLLTGFLGPLILWLVKRQESTFVDFHGKECINFNLSMLLYSIILMAVSLVVAVVTLGIGIFFLFPAYILLGIGLLVLEIMACIAANNGQWHRIPLTIRFIR